MCEFDKTPKKEEVKKCIQIAKENNCVVSLVWRLKWSGRYDRYYYGDENPEEQYESIKNIIYGL